MRNAIVIAFMMAWVAVTEAATNQFEMPLRGVKLPAEKFKLVNHIPRERLARLPKALPVYRYTPNARSFPIAALQAVLDQSPFVGTNLAHLLPSGTNQPATTHGMRLLSQDRLDYFIVIPSEGRVVVQSGERNRGIPAQDAVPSYPVIQERLFRLAAMFGISTNEMERQEDGTLFVRQRGSDTSRFGGAIKYQKSREVEVCRAIPDFPFNSINDDRIALNVGVDGQLRSFNLTWPVIEPVATNRLLSVSKLLKQIKRGQVLSDLMNEYPKGGISEIELKDITIEYYIPGQPLPLAAAVKTDIFPVASLLAVFKSKTGEAVEAGLYTPIMDSR
jgi:hypothetical protein